MMRRLTQFALHQRLAETHGVALVLFTAPGWGACRKRRRALSAPRDLQNCEVDGQADTGLAREFEAFHLPGLCLFRDGRCHGALRSSPEAGAIRATIDARLRLPAEELP